MNVISGVGEDSSLCGYCDRDVVHVQHFVAHTLSVWDYQQLLDLGWRRSGHLLYRPVLERSCCPPHTIRLDTHMFLPSKVYLVAVCSKPRLIGTVGRAELLRCSLVWLAFCMGMGLCTRQTSSPSMWHLAAGSVLCQHRAVFCHCHCLPSLQQFRGGLLLSLEKVRHWSPFPVSKIY